MKVALDFALGSTDANMEKLLSIKPTFVFSVIEFSDG